MVSRETPPNFLSDQLAKVKSKNKHQNMRRGRQETEPALNQPLTFINVIESIIDLGTHKSDEILEMIRLMQKEVDRIKNSSMVAGVGNLIDYEQLYELFIVKRKIELLRFLFRLDRK